MTDAMDPAQYLSKTNTTFLVGDTLNILTGCNTLASVHFGSYIPGEMAANVTMGYLSYSIEDFLNNIKNVPDIFANGTATHQCVAPEIHFTRHQNSQYPTIHNNYHLFANEKIDPELLIMNATWSFFRFNLDQFYVGEPLSAGLFDCTTVRYDWKNGDKIQNRTYDAHHAGNATKQLLKLNDPQSITNLSIICTYFNELIPPVHQHLPSGSICRSSYSFVQLLSVCLASLIVAFV